MVLDLNGKPFRINQELRRVYVYGDIDNGFLRSKWRESKLSLKDFIVKNRVMIDNHIKVCLDKERLEG